MCNLKNRTNKKAKQNRNRLIHTESKLVVVTGKEGMEE